MCSPAQLTTKRDCGASVSVGKAYGSRTRDQMAEAWFCASTSPQVSKMPVKFVTGGWHVCPSGMRNLQAQNFNVYCPLRKERRMWHRRKVEYYVPTFGKYIFVELNLEGHHWRRVNSTSGVKHLLPVHAEEPLPLPQGFVEELKEREANGEVEIYDAARAHFEKRAQSGLPLMPLLPSSGNSSAMTHSCRPPLKT